MGVVLLKFVIAIMIIWGGRGGLSRLLLVGLINWCCHGKTCTDIILAISEI